jgi:hypothetical protein
MVANTYRRILFGLVSCALKTLNDPDLFAPSRKEFTRETPK